MKSNTYIFFLANTKNKTGAKTEGFQGRGGFLEKDFDKQFIYKTQKKSLPRKNFEFFLLDNFKTTF